MIVHICQCLCENRHCIIGFAWEEGNSSLTVESAPRHLQAIVERNIEIKKLNPWCALCLSRNFVYEDAISKFKTMKEALPHIREVEKANIATRIDHEINQRWRGTN